MMRPWVESYAKSTGASLSTGAAISFVTHVALIAAAVVGTTRPAAIADHTGWIANRVYFIPPPNRIAGQAGSRETIRYVELAPEGPGAGLGTPVMDVKRPWRLSETSDLGDMGRDTTHSAEAPMIVGNDTAFTILEVDSAAVRDASSAAPQYPTSLLQQGIEGAVATQYVVDTNGFADPTSLRILRSSHPDFANAVRLALPMMRFSPARIGDHPVRQLVEQEFTFRIEHPDSTKRVVP